jgi:hypothetical protein
VSNEGAPSTIVAEDIANSNQEKPWGGHTQNYWITLIAHVGSGTAASGTRRKSFAMQRFQNRMRKPYWYGIAVLMTAPVAVSAARAEQVLFKVELDGPSVPFLPPSLSPKLSIRSMLHLRR